MSHKHSANKNFPFFPISHDISHQPHTVRAVPDVADNFVVGIVFAPGAPSYYTSDGNTAFLMPLSSLYNLLTIAMITLKQGTLLSLHLTTTSNLRLMMTCLPFTSLTIRRLTISGSCSVLSESIYLPAPLPASL